MLEKIFFLPEHSASFVEEGSARNGYILRACAPAILGGGFKFSSTFGNILPELCRVRQ